MLMSFDCQQCGYQNNEIQNAGKIESKGIKINLRISSKTDINRQVVKSDYTSTLLPHLDFEIPSQSQKGGEKLCHLSELLNSISKALHGLSIYFRGDYN